MTCIVGYVRDSEAWIGADSAASNGYQRFPVVESKIVTLSSGADRTLYLGYTTSFRFGQIAKYHTTLPHDIRDDPSEYLVLDVVPALRKALVDHGWMKKDNERESTGTALIAYRGRVFEYHSDSSVIESRHGMSACGSGEDYALGAMSFAESLGRTPENVIRSGLEAASRFAAGVMEPFDVRRAS